MTVCVPTESSNVCEEPEASTARCAQSTNTCCAKLRPYLMESDGCALPVNFFSSVVGARVVGSALVGSAIPRTGSGGIEGLGGGGEAPAQPSKVLKTKPI